MIQPSTNARKIAAPGNPYDSNTSRIYFWKRTNEGIGEDDIKRRVIRPLVNRKIIHLIKTTPADGSALRIALPRFLAGRLARDLATRVGGNRNVPARRPQSHPL